MHIVKTGAVVKRLTPALRVTAGATVATHVSCQIIRRYTGNINKVWLLLGDIQRNKHRRELHYSQHLISVEKPREDEAGIIC